MSAIIKVSYNLINKQHRADRDGGKLGDVILLADEDGSRRDKKALEFAPLIKGVADDENTVAASDVEDAIAQVRKKIVGQKFYWQMDHDSPEEGLKAGEWLCDVVHAIQIVRAEPVAFTTL